MLHLITRPMLIACCLLLACRAAPPKDDPAIWEKIHLDFSKLDAQGLAGPPNGKVAVNYEFCIPATDAAWRTVQKIDPTAARTAGRGRVGCSPQEWLIVGSTQQPTYRRTLYELARLPFVRRVEEVFWE